MAGNHVLLETISLTQNASSITFDNIPQTGYTDLKILFSGLGNSTQGVYIQFNGSSSNFAGTYVYSDGSSVLTGSLARYLGSIVSSATMPNTGEVYISNYTSNASKPFVVHEAAEINSSTGFNNITQGVWSVNSSITSITIEAANSFRANSTFSLYGIAALGTTPAVAPKATGGNIVANDGTYWYHAFTSSGNFVPQVGLTADVLVVAGGAGGGHWSGGGGGAGGLVYSSAQSLVNGTNYACVVGAGGTAGTSSASGGTGGNSSINSIIAYGGGGGATDLGTGSNNGLPGASGGGGNGGYNNSGGAATPAGQGFPGGGGASGAPFPGGGGGGAAEAGGTDTQGFGGDGLSTYSAWGLATLTGQNISGTVFYAGGGGGGTGAGSTLKVGGDGGGGNGGYGYGGTVLNPTRGTPNTGGGGGGGTSVADGAAGGSGIVIVRYPIN